MKCPICRTGDTQPGKATVTLEREGLTLVVRGVPARVCGNCGEEYVDEVDTERLMAAAEDALRAGVKVDVREYTIA
ncbi:MAG: type II toxin-antitoxin system MqsA family antitoxin [Dongiaceae bacterium]